MKPDRQLRQGIRNRLDGLQQRRCSSYFGDRGAFVYFDQYTSLDFFGFPSF
jgi:hypothetical protein